MTTDRLAALHDAVEKFLYDLGGAEEPHVVNARRARLYDIASIAAGVTVGLDVKRPKVTHEIRPDDDGNADEVVVYVNGRCVVHTERLDKHLFYLGLYTDDGDVQGYFRAPSGKRVVNEFPNGEVARAYAATPAQPEPDGVEGYQAGWDAAMRRRSSDQQVNPDETVSVPDTRLREVAQAAAFALNFHNQTPTGRRRTCDPECIACAAIVALRAAIEEAER